MYCLSCLLVLVFPLLYFLSALSIVFFRLAHKIAEAGTKGDISYLDHRMRELLHREAFTISVYRR